MANSLTNGIHAFTVASFTEPVTNRIIVTPTPIGVTLDFGFEQKEVLQTDDLGVTYAADIVTTSKAPKITVSYGALTPEVLALKTGFKAVEESSTGIYARTFRATQTTYPAVTTGQDGYGMAADSASASVLRNGISVELTRSAFSAYDSSAGTDTFANGANATFKFHDDIVAAKEWVTVYGTYTVSDAKVLTEDAFDTFKLSLVGVMNDKTVFNMVFDPVTLSRTDSNSIDFTADTQEIVFRITDPSCSPTIRFLGTQRTC